MIEVNTLSVKFNQANYDIRETNYLFALFFQWKRLKRNEKIVKTTTAFIQYRCIF